jgi:N-acetylneuraminic acid mutarotase
VVGFVRAWGVSFPANGRFYAMGGRTSDTAGSDLQNPREYDPATDTWTTKAAAFADNQVNNMVGGVLNFGGTDFIVVVGGSAAGATTASSEVRQYNPLTDTMTTLASDPWPQNAGGATLPGGAAVFGNKLYVFGGFQINVSMITTVWQFDPAAAAGSRWTLKTATLPAPIGYIPAATAGSMIYLLGGSDFVGGTIVDTSSTLRYDPGADTITPIATIPRATGETRAVMQPFDNSIWVLGGGRVAPNPSNEVDVYLPGSNTWTVAPAFPTGRRNFPADMDPALGRIWTTGGYPVSGVPDVMNEEFDCVVPVELMSFGVE